MAIDRELQKQAEELIKQINDAKTVMYDLETTSANKGTTGKSYWKDDQGKSKPALNRHAVTFSAY
jgi:hypothetical protein